MELFNSFATSSKADWLKKINQDLKGRKIEELNIQLLPDLKVSPFAHRDDISSDITIPESKKGPSVLGFSIDVRDEQKANLLLLEALEGGASFIEISCSQEKILDFQILLENILLDLIDARFSFANEVNSDGLRDFLVTNYLEEVVDRISIYDSKHDTHIDHSLYLGDVVIDDISTLVSTLNCGAMYLEKNLEPESTTYVKVHFGHNYIQNIITIRTLRLLWSNLCAAYEIDQSEINLIIHGHIADDAIVQDPNDNMIAFTQIAMGMISGGVDVLFLSPSDQRKHQNGTPNSRRISRNIFHLMALEGHMNIVKDTASGSYLFDKLTVSLSKNIWELFLNERRDG